MADFAPLPAVARAFRSADYASTGVQMKGADYTNPDPESGRTVVATPGMIDDPDAATPAFVDITGMGDDYIKESQLGVFEDGRKFARSDLVKSGGAVRQGVNGILPHSEIAMGPAGFIQRVAADVPLMAVSVEVGDVSYDIKIKGLFQNEDGTITTLQLIKGPRPVKFPVSGDEPLPIVFTPEGQSTFTAYYSGINFDVPDGGQTSVFYVFATPE